MNKPTTAITDAMIDCFSAASNIRLAFNNHRAQVAAGLDAVLAMQSATPSTPELEELVEPVARAIYAQQANASAFEVIRHTSKGNQLFRYARAALEAAGISELQKEIDTKTAALENAVRFLRAAPLESGICCCGNPIEGHGYHDGHSPVDELQYHSHGLVETLEAALSSKGGV
jgi:hypothetical protein